MSSMVVREGASLVLPGIALGALAAAWLSDLLAAMVFGVSTIGWSAVVTVSALTAALLVACYVPARRASRVDPVDALRW